MDFSTYMAALKGLGADLNESAQRVNSRMNGAALAVTMKSTPVGDYPSQVAFTTKDGKAVSFSLAKKEGGTLRRGWQNGGTKRVGNGFESRYFNNVLYGGYVNDGHRIVNRHGETVGYKEGVHMLEQGQNTAKAAAGAIFSAEIQRVKNRGGW